MPNILYRESKKANWINAVDNTRYTLLDNGDAYVSVHDDFITTDIIIPNGQWAYTTKEKDTAYQSKDCPEFNVKLRKGVLDTEYVHEWTDEEFESCEEGNLQHWDIKLKVGNLTLKAIDLAADGEEGAVSALLDFLTEHDGIEYDNVFIV